MKKILFVFAVLAFSPPAAADYTLQMQQGLGARAAGDFPAAEAAFDAATRAAPGDAQAWHMLGLMRGFQGKYDSALAALDRAEQIAPDDLDIAVSIARVTAFAGRYDVAERRIEAVLAREPELAEAWVLKGRIAGYQNQFDAAKSAYDKAASLLTPDVDLLVAYGDLARAQNDETTARSYYLRAVALDPNSADVKDRLSGRERENANPWTLSVSGGKSWLSRTPAPDWTAAEATLDRDFGDGLHLFGGLSYARRFSTDDITLRGGGRAAGGRMAASLELGYTPDDAVLPEFQAFTTLTARLIDGSGPAGPSLVVLDGQFRKYAGGNVKTLSPGLDQYIADGRFTLSLRWTNTWDTTNRYISGWSVGGLWQAIDRIGLRLGYGNAPEAERGVVADTKTLSGGVILGVTDRVTWRIDLSRENRQGGYRRFEAVSGLAVKF